MRAPLVLVLGATLTAAAGGVQAQPADVAAVPDTAVFAIIVGANRSVDRDLKPLLYADDDAARYQLLFHSLGARTILLTRPDDNTRRVLPGAVVSSTLPRRQPLEQAVATLADEVKAARARGRRTAFYFLFAGHGNADREAGRAYLTLEDARLTGEDLERTVLRAVGAHESHLIVDACYSYFLARGRGPGGRARMVRGFSASAGGLSPEVGLLLSTSSARESHEWDGFQAGVFSHEVRSGLHGAADIDGDGRISYREIAAFVVRANAAIPNERLRPDVFARPPQGSPQLLDLRPGLARSLMLDGETREGHYLLEDWAGNRLIDFNRARGTTLRLIRPGLDLVFLRHVQTGQEYQLEAAAPELHVAQLAPKQTPVRTRGAAHHAFSLIFSLPFDAQAVQGYRFVDIEITLSLRDDPPPRAPVWRRGIASGLFVASGLVGAASAVQVLQSRDAADKARTANQQDADRLNRIIDQRRRSARALGLAAAGGVAGGLVLWFWPTSPVVPVASVSAGQPGVLGVEGRF